MTSRPKPRAFRVILAATCGTPQPFNTETRTLSVNSGVADTAGTGLFSSGPGHRLATKRKAPARLARSQSALSCTLFPTLKAGKGRSPWQIASGQAKQRGRVPRTRVSSPNLDEIPGRHNRTPINDGETGHKGNGKRGYSADHDAVGAVVERGARVRPAGPCLCERAGRLC